MKRVLFLVAFSVLLFANAFCEKCEVKIAAKAAYPVDFGENQSDYYSLGAMAELSVCIPVYKNLGINICADGEFGNFQKNLIFDKNPVGSYQFYSFFAGAFYRVNLGNSFLLMPSLSIGFTQSSMKLSSSGKKRYDSLFSIQAAVDLEKKLNDEWGLYANTSFGYYGIYCPLSLGVGVLYSVN